MKNSSQSHRRRYYVRQTYNAIHKHLEAYRKTNPHPNFDDLKYQTLMALLNTPQWDNIAVLPIGVSRDLPLKIALSITDPTKPNARPLTVVV